MTTSFGGSPLNWDNASQGHAGQGVDELALGGI